MAVITGATGAFGNQPARGGGIKVRARIAAGQDSTTEIVKVVREQSRQIDELRRAVEDSGIRARSSRSPAQITSNRNNYDAGPIDSARLQTDAARNITGFSGGRGGRYLLVINIEAFNIVLKHQDAASDAANRMIGIGAADVTLTPNEAAQLWYDATDSRWRIIWKTT